MRRCDSWRMQWVLNWILDYDMEWLSNECVDVMENAAASQPVDVGILS